MTAKPVSRDFLYKPSKRVTDSRLDDLLVGYFLKMDMRSENLLIEQLEAARQLLIANKSRLNDRVYDCALAQSYAEERVGERALQQLRSESPDRYVAAKDQNAYKFAQFNFPELTDQLAVSLNRLLAPRSRMQLFQSGRQWYPSNGYMGWHTNANVPGFRLYFSHANEANKSFFRYCDPGSGELITDWDDQGWSFRCFRTDLEPFWHSVLSRTDRISLGFGIKFPIG